MLFRDACAEEVPELAHAEAGTIRRKVLKVGAWVRTSARRIWFHLSAWWPFVEEEWAEAQAHYDKLGLADRAELVLHDSGHEVIPSKAVEFFRKWL